MISVVEAMHGQLRRQLTVDGIYTCFHDERGRLRLPQTGARSAFGRIRRPRDRLGRSVMVGDRWRDVEAGRRAGCRTVFIDRATVNAAAEGPDMSVIGPDRSGTVDRRRRRGSGGDDG